MFSRLHSLPTFHPMQAWYCEITKEAQCLNTKTNCSFTGGECAFRKKWSRECWAIAQGRQSLASKTEANSLPYSPHYASRSYTACRLRSVIRKCTTDFATP